MNTTQILEYECRLPDMKQTKVLWNSDRPSLSHQSFHPNCILAERSTSHEQGKGYHDLDDPENIKGLQ